jgi:hypothetical protein
MAQRCPKMLLTVSSAIRSPDFSVVLFRPDFMLLSEEHPMKSHKNQRLVILLSPP